MNSIPLVYGRSDPPELGALEFLQWGLGCSRLFFLDHFCGPLSTVAHFMIGVHRTRTENPASSVAWMVVLANL